MSTKLTKVAGKIATVPLTRELIDGLLDGCQNERKVRIRHIDLLKRAIEIGGWNNSSVISITKSGELLDGHHRVIVLKELGYPRINLQMCVYDDEEVTPTLRSSFNKAAPQRVSDTMKMCYAWTCSTRRCGIISSFYRCFVSPTPIVNCDDTITLAVDNAFANEINEFMDDSHLKNQRKYASDMLSAFIAMRIFKGDSVSDKLKILKYDSEYRLNCDSLRCIPARINDYAFSPRPHSLEKRSVVLRVCVAINMFLNGKTTCVSLDKFKDEDVFSFGNIIRSDIQRKFAAKTKGEMI